MLMRLHIPGTCALMPTTRPYANPQGDLMVHILENARGELRKPANEVSRPRLQVSFDGDAPNQWLLLLVAGDPLDPLTA